VNLHPQEGEAAFFLATAVNQPPDTDYAIVALLPGLNPNRSILILAGISTVGTQAAAEFVCGASFRRRTFASIGSTAGGKVSLFEAVLRVNVMHDAPVKSELLALRRSNRF
jgi:hypothetical protein